MRRVLTKPVAVLMVLIVATSLAAEAQQPGTIYRIGFLGAGAEVVYTDLLRAFRAGLRELGYVEGKNIAVESRFAEDKYERLRDLGRTGSR